MILGVIIIGVALIAFLAGYAHGQMTEAQARRRAAEDHGGLRRSAGRNYWVDRHIGSFW